MDTRIQFLAFFLVFLEQFFPHFEVTLTEPVSNSCQIAITVEKDMSQVDQVFLSVKFIKIFSSPAFSSFLGGEKIYINVESEGSNKYCSASPVEAFMWLMECLN